MFVDKGKIINILAISIIIIGIISTILVNANQKVYQQKHGNRGHKPKQ